MHIKRPAGGYMHQSPPTAVQILHLLQVDSLVVGIMQELLSSVPASCELHYVGKRGGQPSIKQPAINQLLVALCQQVGGHTCLLLRVTLLGWCTIVLRAATLASLFIRIDSYGAASYAACPGRTYRAHSSYNQSLLRCADRARQWCGSRAAVRQHSAG